MTERQPGSSGNLIQRWYDEGYYGRQTLADVLLAGAEQFPSATLVLESEMRPGRVALAASVEESQYLANALYRLGIRKGDVVAVQLPNWIEAALLSQAVWLLEAVLLPVSAIYEVRDLSYILEDAGAKVLFLPGQWRGRDYREGVSELRQLTAVQEIIVLDELAPPGSINWTSFRQEVRGELPVRSASADDLALLLYTSGTTARPKGVMHTHNTLLAEVRAGQAMYGEQALGSYLNPWPYGHVAALLPLLRWWLYGVDTVLADRWEPDYIAQLVQRHRITATTGVPYFLTSLLEAADRTGCDISSLANYGTGAANVPAELVEQCRQRGIYAYRIYGSTEHPTVTAGLPTDPVDKRINTDGRCLPGSEARIVDDSGADVAVGEEGEIAVRGPELFIGYLRPQDNEGAFLEGGWFLTGDIGNLDAEAYLTITDRKKDIIIRGGENISSREVEEVLASHPAVLETAAIAMPAPKLGERVCAVVVLKPGHTLSLDEVVQHFRDQGMARQKTPEQLVEVAQLPRTATGKVQKQALRDQLRQA
jgi:acyl-CoA synthetase (AMP-forming)/AMP-acid ligase II